MEVPVAPPVEAADDEAAAAIKKRIATRAQQSNGKVNGQSNGKVNGNG